MVTTRNFFILFFFLPFITYSQKDIFDIARFGNVDEIKQLMKINPDTINKTDSNGYLPLTLACYRGNKDVALYLAKNVEDINAGSKYGTALMAAVFKGETEIVSNLLKNNANPNLADSSGNTPLHYAAIKRNEDIVKLLVDAGADKNAKDFRGKTALNYAEINRNQNIIKLLTSNN